MFVRLASVSLLLMGFNPIWAQEKPEKVVLDIWNAAHLSGQHAGWVHTITREVERDGQKVLRTQTDLELHVARESDAIRLRMITGTEETPEGKVTGVFTRQFLGQTQQLAIAGVVAGPELISNLDQGDGKVSKKKVPWSEANIGLYGQEMIFKNRKVKPGDEFTFQSFEPTVNNVITTHASVKNFESVKTLKETKTLLRVDLKTDKLDDGKTVLQLPPMTVWLDQNYDSLRTDSMMESLGPITLYRTTKAVATTLPAGKPAVNIGLNSLIPLNYRINQPYDAEEVVYHITVRGDEHPETAFARDARQTIRKLHGNTIEMVVRATPTRKPGEKEAEPGEEYLKSNYFINSDDEKVREHTRRAVGPTTDPWQKALNIEHYVHLSIKNKNYKEAFATADQVARTLEGDCTEHAVLAAAMCRAAGLPSRTAVGLLYVDHAQKGPVMGFHMWAEVWVDGRWRPIDGVLGRGFVDATHLKISDHSWHDVQSLTPLLPVYRVLGKLDIQVMTAQSRYQR